MRIQGMKAAALAAAVVLLAGTAQAAVNTGSATMTKVVAIGDSWGMGVSNASILVGHQQNSFPALVAKQVGITDFQQPLVSEPGIGPEYALFSLVPSPVIGPKASSSGSPTNLTLPRAYDNMAIAGANTCDVVNKRAGTSASDATNLVLRGSGATQLEMALSLRPTFVLVHIGGNDVLGAVLSGVAIDGVTLTPPATVQACYHQIMASIAAVGAKAAVATFPNRVAEAPYANAVKPYVTLSNGTKLYLSGQKGDGSTIQLTDRDYLGLAAGAYIQAGYGLPAGIGNGQPLPNSVVIDRDEVAAIEARADAIHAIIRSEANAAGAAIVEEGAFFHSLYASPMKIGGMSLGTGFLTGGVYGYDGFHPTDIGYGLIANLFIAAINDKFNADIPGVDMFPLLFGPSASPRALLSDSEASQAVFEDGAEDQLRGLTGVPSRDAIEAILAAQQTTPAEETPADVSPEGEGPRDAGIEAEPQPVLDPVEDPSGEPPVGEDTPNPRGHFELD